MVLVFRLLNSDLSDSAELLFADTVTGSELDIFDDQLVVPVLTSSELGFYSCTIASRVLCVFPLLQVYPVVYRDSGSFRGGALRMILVIIELSPCPLVPIFIRRFPVPPNVFVLVSASV